MFHKWSHYLRQSLPDEVEPPPSGQPLVPDGGEQLLHVGVRDELLLLELERQLEPLEGLRLPGVPDVAVGVVVEHDLQLVRGARVVEQVRRELHHLHSELAVLGAELGLHPLEPESSERKAVFYWDKQRRGRTALGITAFPIQENHSHIHFCIAAQLTS